MQIETGPLAPGLYLVATPIGAARDITLRALDILASADVIAAEDTRTARHLMQIHGVALGGRPVVAYHDHSGPAARARLIGDIAAGRAVAYVSEAGTPLVADPGYQLVRAAVDEGHKVIAAPGPSALLAALSVSGLPTDRVFFAGFPPVQASARAAQWQGLKGLDATIVLYESPKRINRLLAELRDVWGEDRQAAVCRELTKRFEEVSRGALGALAADFDSRQVKGEIVLVIDRGGTETADDATLEAALRAALDRLSVKDAVAEVSAALNLPRRQVYQAALALEDGK
ncbi:16S rRNA (cytidine(1402)-2'-O)-methyltransferase [Rhodovulum iodosum]|nr:16S rRNA (cytidine(1402)-2'-O)-methyltransferase [Rhodovulum robiginosum]RSK30732.1 16S rRNA (cytidine(1402)-2'-O)-methyltransferase [Rhodovulum robiginosum]